MDEASKLGIRVIMTLGDNWVGADSKPIVSPFPFPTSRTLKEEPVPLHCPCCGFSCMANMLASSWAVSLMGISVAIKPGDSWIGAERVLVKPEAFYPTRSLCQLLLPIQSPQNLFLARKLVLFARLANYSQDRPPQLSSVFRLASEQKGSNGVFWVSRRDEESLYTCSAD